MALYIQGEVVRVNCAGHIDHQCRIVFKSIADHNDICTGGEIFLDLFWCTNSSADDQRYIDDTSDRGGLSTARGPTDAGRP